MDDWLRRRALINQTSGASRCFATSRDGRVVGYYALVISLGRLAVDHKEQGHSLGSHLLRDAIARTVQVAEIVGIRALLVHAFNERARDFCLHHDVEPSPTDPLHLMLPMSDARAIVSRQARHRS